MPVQWTQATSRARQPLTCRLLPLLLKQVSGTYGGTGRQPLQPGPALVLGERRGPSGSLQGAQQQEKATQGAASL